MTIERFRFDGVDLVQHEQGRWVRYEDHAAEIEWLKAELADLSLRAADRANSDAAEIERLQDLGQFYLEEVKLRLELEVEIEKLLALLKEAREHIYNDVITHLPLPHHDPYKMHRYQSRANITRRIDAALAEREVKT